MKNLIALVGVLAVVAAIPVPDSKPQSSLDLLEIPLGNNKELDILSLADENGKITDRNKRTIDILRQLFPTLTQIFEAKIQAILPILIRSVGPLLLRGAGGGAGGAGTTSNNDSDDDDDFNSEVEKNTGGRKVSVSLPSFEVGADDDEDEEEVAPAAPSSTVTTTTTTTETQSSSSSSSTAPIKELDESSITRIDLPTTFDDDQNQQLNEDESSVTDKLDTENQIV